MATPYDSCRSLPWRLVGVGMPSLVGLLGAILVAASPQRPGVTVRLVAAGFGDDSAAETPWGRSGAPLAPQAR